MWCEVSKLISKNWSIAKNSLEIPVPMEADSGTLYPIYPTYHIRDSILVDISGIYLMTGRDLFLVIYFSNVEVVLGIRLNTTLNISGLLTCDTYV